MSVYIQREGASLHHYYYYYYLNSLPRGESVDVLLYVYSPIPPVFASPQEHVAHKYAKEIPAWLACYAQPAHASCFPDWACFLETFLRQGQTPIVSQ